MLKQPKDNVFTGKLYVITNGISFSSAADLVSDLKKTQTRLLLVKKQAARMRDQLVVTT